MTADDDPYLPPEATGSAPGRARLAGRRVLVVGAGTRPSPEPDPPIGNGRAITVLAAREGAGLLSSARKWRAPEMPGNRAEQQRNGPVRAPWLACGAPPASPSPAAAARP